MLNVFYSYLTTPIPRDKRKIFQLTWIFVEIIYKYISIHSIYYLFVRVRGVYLSSFILYLQRKLRRITYETKPIKVDISKQNLFMNYCPLTFWLKKYTEILKFTFSLCPSPVDSRSLFTVSFRLTVSFLVVRLVVFLYYKIIPKSYIT